jgi:hypothetical protein
MLTKNKILWYRFSLSASTETVCEKNRLTRPGRAVVLLPVKVGFSEAPKITRSFSITEFLNPSTCHFARYLTCAFFIGTIKDYQKMENEITPDPDPPRRTEAKPMRDVKAEPVHQMPKFIDRHEPAVEGLQRRAHLLPSEWAGTYNFDSVNQPLAMGRQHDPQFKDNVMKSNPTSPRFDDPSKT